MSRMREKRNYILIMISMFTLLLMISPLASGNPIPYDIPLEGRSGGDPLPKTDDLENLSVYLNEETIKVRLFEDHAKIEAEYIFFSEDTGEDEIEICLPFVNEPWDVKVVCEGYEINFKGYSIFYEPINHRSIYFEFSHEYLSCILFTIPISYLEETSIIVTYNSYVSKYDSSLNSYVRYYFSYLVGTARYWNHSIEKAHFEFRMSTDLCDSENKYLWNRTKSEDEYIFTLTYYDWTPTKDLVSFSWEQDRGTLEKISLKIHQIWGGIKYRPQAFICCGISIVFLIFTVLSIYLNRKKKRVRVK